MFVMPRTRLGEASGKARVAAPRSPWPKTLGSRLYVSLSTRLGIDRRGPPRSGLTHFRPSASLDSPTGAG